MKRILRNVARCLLCMDILESKHRHDFVTCQCGSLSVDGGRDYIRRLFGDSDYVAEMSEYEDGA